MAKLPAEELDTLSVGEVPFRRPHATDSAYCADSAATVEKNISLMRLARKRIWVQLEEMNDHKLNLKMLVDDVNRIPQEQWERLGLWEAVTQMVVQASHMQNWSAASVIGEVMEGPHGVDPEA